MFPEFPSHTNNGGITEHEVDALHAWARQQDPRSGRGAMIMSLIASADEFEDLVTKYQAVLNICVDVAGDLELVQGDLKKGMGVKGKLEAAIKKLEEAKDAKS